MTDAGFSIVLVEDNPGDVFLVREALEEAGFPNVLTVARDGDRAMELFRRGASGGIIPDLVILDLNLPGMSGRQVMAEMEKDAALKKLPVAILTTAHNESEIGGEFPGLRITFAAKTPDFGQLVAIMKRFRDFACSS